MTSPQEPNSNEIWPEDVYPATEEIDWNQVDGTATDLEITYPRMQWMHGQRAKRGAGKLAEFGGLLIPEESAGEIRIPGWEPATYITQDGTELRGFHNPDPYLAVIRKTFVWQENTSKTFVLVCVRGSHELFELTADGPTKGKPIDDAIAQHQRQIVALVNRHKPARAAAIEPLALWLRLKAAPHVMYASKTKPDSKSEVTLPTLYVPASCDLAYARGLYVGSQNYQAFKEHFRATEGWEATKRARFGSSNHEPPQSPLLKQANALLLWLGTQGDDVGFITNHILGIAGKTQLEQLSDAELREAVEYLNLQKRKHANHLAQEAQS